MKRGIVCIAISFVISGMVFSTDCALDSMDLESMEYYEDDWVMVPSKELAKKARVDDGAKGIEFECLNSMDGFTDLTDDLEFERNRLKFRSENPLTAADMLKKAEFVADICKKGDFLTPENISKKADLVVDMNKKEDFLTPEDISKKADLVVDMDKKEDFLTPEDISKKADLVVDMDKKEDFLTPEDSSKKADLVVDMDKKEDFLTPEDISKKADLVVDMDKKKDSLTRADMLKKAGVDDGAKCIRRECLYCKNGFTKIGVDMDKKTNLSVHRNKKKDSLTRADMLKKADSGVDKEFCILMDKLLKIGSEDLEEKFKIVAREYAGYLNLCDTQGISFQYLKTAKERVLACMSDFEKHLCDRMSEFKILKIRTEEDKMKELLLNEDQVKIKFFEEIEKVKNLHGRCVAIKEWLK